MNAQTWKGFLTSSLLIASFLLFLAGEARPASAPAIQSPAPLTPSSVGILHFVIVKAIGPPVPFVASTSIGHYVKDNVYEPLVMFDQKGDIHPWLAESWTSNSNSSEWTFK